MGDGVVGVVEDILAKVAGYVVTVGATGVVGAAGGAWVGTQLASQYGHAAALGATAGCVIGGAVGLAGAGTVLYLKWRG